MEAMGRISTLHQVLRNYWPRNCTIEHRELFYDGDDASRLRSVAERSPDCGRTGPDELAIPDRGIRQAERRIPERSLRRHRLSRSNRNHGRADCGTARLSLLPAAGRLRSVDPSHQRLFTIVNSALQ